jgi:hypothetical protein
MKSLMDEVISSACTPTESPQRRFELISELAIIRTDRRGHLPINAPDRQLTVHALLPNRSWLRQAM